MVNRRIILKSLGLLSGSPLLAALPVKLAAANTPTLRWGQKAKIAVAGNGAQCKQLLKFAAKYPNQISITAFAGENLEDFTAHLQSLGLPAVASFSSVQEMLQNIQQADTVYFAGAKERFDLSVKALNTGLKVWSDRPLSFEYGGCAKINNFAKGNFSKAQVAYFVDGELCLMENKIYNAPV